VKACHIKTRASMQHNAQSKETGKKTQSSAQRVESKGENREQRTDRGVSGKSKQWRGTAATELPVESRGAIFVEATRDASRG
jgi:hypothetical protein